MEISRSLHGSHKVEITGKPYRLVKCPICFWEFKDAPPPQILSQFPVQKSAVSSRTSRFVKFVWPVRFNTEIFFQVFGPREHLALAEPITNNVGRQIVFFFRRWFIRSESAGVSRMGIVLPQVDGHQLMSTDSHTQQK